MGGPHNHTTSQRDVRYHCVSSRLGCGKSHPYIYPLAYVHGFIMFHFVNVKFYGRGIHSFHSPELVNWPPELGQEASDVFPTRTTLYKPQVTPSNILWRSGVTLGHVDSITRISYTCEAGEC